MYNHSKEVLRLAETRATEISNGTKRLAELSNYDRTECLAAAEAEAKANLRPKARPCNLYVERMREAEGRG